MYTIDECERVFLGHLIARPEIIDGIDIPDSLFYSHNNSAIFEAIRKAREGGIKPDLIMISDELIKAGHRDLLGVLSAIEKPQEFETHTYYFEKLLEYSRKREIKKVVAKMNEDIDNPMISSIELADKALESLSEAIQKTNVVVQSPTIKSIIPEYVADLEKRVTDYKNHTSKFVDTGFSELDAIMGPICQDELVLVAARPGCGKSAYSLQVCDHVTSEHFVPSAYFSLEMSQFSLIDRIMAKNKAATVRELRTGKLASDQLLSVHDLCEQYYESEIAIYDTSQTAAQLHSRIRREVLTRKTGFVTVDYLGLIDGLGADGAKARWEKVGEESRALKRLAHDLHIIIMVCVQLGRDADGKEPSSAMLRDSGSLEQDADRIILLWGDDKEMEKDMRDINIKVSKNRNGALGRVVYEFDGPHTCFNRKLGVHENPENQWDGIK